MAIDNPRDLVNATFDDLQEFVARRIHETEALDYKADFGDDITTTVAAMANTDGGVILIGVSEDSKTKTPSGLPGISARDARGTLTSKVSAYLDPTPRLETQIVELPDDRVVLVVLVHPSTTRAVLHIEQGLKVRVGDQSRAPNRSAFERLLARELTATTDAATRQDRAAGRASRWAGPGDDSGNLYVVIAADPLTDVDVVPSERLDDLVVEIANRMFGGGFASAPEVDRLAAQRYLGNDLPVDHVSITRSGQIDVRLFVAGPGSGSGPPSMIEPTQLAVEAMRCLIFPFAVARAEPSLAVVIPAAAALSFSGWDKHLLDFGRRIPALPGSSRVDRFPVRQGKLVEPSDAFVLARDGVRQLARFYGQRGADAWADTVASKITNAAHLEEWMSELLA